MSKINSKAKGSKNERDLAKVFKDWTGFEFTRVPSSGGLRWKRTLDTTGDIMVAEEAHIFDFPFSIETKFYKEVNPWKILRGQQSDLDKFMEQAKADADRSGKLPLVFFRFNGMPKYTWFVIMLYEDFEELSSEIFCEFGFMNFNQEYVIFYSPALFESEYKNLLKLLRDGCL